jgi:hypothetical protein
MLQIRGLRGAFIETDSQQDLINYFKLRAADLFIFFLLYFRISEFAAKFIIIYLDRYIFAAIFLCKFMYI